MPTKSTSQKTRIAIIGSGIAGMTALHELNTTFKNNAEVEFILIDPNLNFVFTPRLTELITGATKEKYLIKPKSVFKKQKNMTIIESKAKSINLKSKEILLNTKKKQTVTYDYLILSQGASTNYCGIKGAQKFCFPYKTYKDAQRLKEEITTKINSTQNKEFNIIIAGAGPTGVETAFAIKDAINKAKQQSQESKFNKNPQNNVSQNKINVHIIDSGNYLLKKLPMYFQTTATKRAKAKGIIFHTQERVKQVHKNEVELQSGKVIQSDITIWAAGVTPNVIETVPKITEHSGHIKVQRTMQVFPHTFPEVFAVGDCTSLELPNPKKPTSQKIKDTQKRRKQRVPCYPPTAQIASREAECAAQNIITLIKQSNKEQKKNQITKLKQFNYKSKGWFVELSEKQALAQAGPICFKEPLAWHMRDKYYKFFFWKLTKGY